MFLLLIYMYIYIDISVKDIIAKDLCVFLLIKM